MRATPGTLVLRLVVRTGSAANLESIPLNNPQFLRDLWYFALPGRMLKRGAMRATTLLDEPLLLGRDRDGAPFALQDICPHRAMPLSYGEFDGREVECCYHGWRFNTSGRCTAIPSLTEEQRARTDLARIGVHAYPCREEQGNIWVYFGEASANLPAVPRIPDVESHHHALSEVMTFPSDIDHAVVGLMDPAHGPFVHRSWWWRSAKSIHAKEKRFGPSHLGFSMLRHAPSSNSRFYKVLGGTPQTEISFQLPGVRIEHVQTGAHLFCGLTAVTPITASKTRVSHIIYSTMPWLRALSPLLRPFARAFLNQDKRVVARQSEGLVHDPKLMLINDADVQARWYYQIRREYLAAQADKRDFVNPVKETTLRWRS